MKIYQWYILLFLSLLIGLLIGSNLNIDFLKIKTDGIALDQLFTIIITLFVGWYIPSKISKIIEDKRIIRNQLVDEINTFLNFIKEVKIKVNRCFATSSITLDDKTEINLLFEEADLLLDNLRVQIEVVNNQICNNALQAYYNYWQYVTGGNLMNSSYMVVDLVFNSRIIVEHYKLEIVFKQLAQSIQTTE